MPPVTAFRGCVLFLRISRQVSLIVQSFALRLQQHMVLDVPDMLVRD